MEILFCLLLQFLSVLLLRYELILEITRLVKKKSITNGMFRVETVMIILPV